MIFCVYIKKNRASPVLARLTQRCNVFKLLQLKDIQGLKLIRSQPEANYLRAAVFLRRRAVVFLALLAVLFLEDLRADFLAVVFFLAAIIISLVEL